ncbi:MAG: hypothetical protein ABW167_21980, partial [Baekduia sp.]
MAIEEERAAALERQLRDAIVEAGWGQLLVEVDAAATAARDADVDLARPAPALARLERLVDRLLFVVTEGPALERRVREQLDALREPAGLIEDVR